MIINTLKEINKHYWKKMLNFKNKLKEVSYSVNQSRSCQSTESQVSMKSLSHQFIKNYSWRKSFTLFNVMNVSELIRTSQWFSWDLI